MRTERIRRWMTIRGRVYFSVSSPSSSYHSLFFQSVCRACAGWNTPLYLHPNDPSSGPRGWALCNTQRSIRARAWRLLCPIINPYQLPLSHCRFSSSPTRVLHPHLHLHTSPKWPTRTCMHANRHVHAFLQSHSIWNAHGHIQKENKQNS